MGGACSVVALVVPPSSGARGSSRATILRDSTRAATSGGRARATGRFQRRRAPRVGGARGAAPRIAQGRTRGGGRNWPAVADRRVRVGVAAVRRATRSPSTAKGGRVSRGGRARRVLFTLIVSGWRSLGRCGAVDHQLRRRCARRSCSVAVAVLRRGGRSSSLWAALALLVIIRHLGNSTVGAPPRDRTRARLRALTIAPRIGAAEGTPMQSVRKAVIRPRGIGTALLTATKSSPKRCSRSSTGRDH